MQGHRLTTGETVVSLATDLDRGLTASEVQTRLAEYGPNTITPQKGIGPFRRALAQFNQPLILILIVAGAVTAALGEWVDAGVIFGVVVINASIGYLQEAKAVKAIEALSRAMTVEATVVRDGQRIRLSASELVPGDVVILQAGDKIPADTRLTYSRDLRVDESALTGESLPVEKQTDPLLEETALADRTNMGYASTLVTAGQGAGIVVATGDATEVGRISDLIATAHDIKTPLTRKIAAFSKVLLYVILGLAVLTAIVGMLRGEPVADMFMAAVALAVGAIPEGLPAAVTITLAIGVSRMAHRRAIIRKLPAVETLGSTTVICSDKTGTLTENQMTVQHIATGAGIYAVTGGGYTPEGTVDGPIAVPRDEPSGKALGAGLAEVLRAGALCNDSSLYQEEGHWRISGDPTEGALIVSAIKAGLNPEELERLFPRLDTVPFESEHQYMATLHRVVSPHGPGAFPGAEGRIAYVKGAVEKVVARCSSELSGDGSLIPVDTQRVERLATEMASQGLRVLAFACKDLPADTDEITHEEVETGLIFLGLQGMIDPPRAAALEAIKACHAAGIQVKMITGDHALTAAAIAYQLNLRRPGCMTLDDMRPLNGTQLAALSDADLVQAGRGDLRVRPRHSGTEAALGERAAEPRARGSHDGRRSQRRPGSQAGRHRRGHGHNRHRGGQGGRRHDPHRRQLRFHRGGGGRGSGSVRQPHQVHRLDAAHQLGRGSGHHGRHLRGRSSAYPARADLVDQYDHRSASGPRVGLRAQGRGHHAAFSPRTKAPILDRVLIGRIVLVGVLLLAGAFGLFEYAQQTGQTLAEARTVAANVFVFGEMFYLFNCRSLTLPSWRVSLRTNHFLLGGVGLMLTLQLLYTYLPGMNRLFGSAPSPSPAGAGSSP